MTTDDVWGSWGVAPFDRGRFLPASIVTLFWGAPQGAPRKHGVGGKTGNGMKQQDQLSSPLDLHIHLNNLSVLELPFGSNKSMIGQFHWWSWSNIHLQCSKSNTYMAISEWGQEPLESCQLQKGFKKGYNKGNPLKRPQLRVILQLSVKVTICMFTVRWLRDFLSSPARFFLWVRQKERE